MNRYIIPAVFIAGVVGLFLLTQSSEYEMVRDMNVVEIEQTEEPAVAERDVVDQAQAELNRINEELDAEETRILEEQATLRAEYEAQSAEYEARLERIRETRTSFR